MATIPEDRYTGASWGQRGWCTATLYGTENEVREKAARYFKEFNPRGYDTHTVIPPRDTGKGYWTTVIDRWTSCD